MVNIQGDEPFLSAAALAGAVDMVRAGFDIGTAAGTVVGDAAQSPSLVKVVCTGNGRALYFSRSAIPFYRDAGSAGHRRYNQHIGVYACTRGALLQWASLPPTPLELSERLEQLRAWRTGSASGSPCSTKPPCRALILRKTWSAPTRTGPPPYEEPHDLRPQDHQVHLRHRRRGVVTRQGDCRRFARAACWWSAG